jgi:hypothetical protein
MGRGSGPYCVPLYSMFGRPRMGGFRGAQNFAGRDNTTTGAQMERNMKERKNADPRVGPPSTAAAGSDPVPERVTLRPLPQPTKRHTQAEPRTKQHASELSFPSRTSCYPHLCSPSENQPPCRVAVCLLALEGKTRKIAGLSSFEKKTTARAQVGSFFRETQGRR